MDGFMRMPGSFPFLFFSQLNILTAHAEFTIYPLLTGVNVHVVPLHSTLNSSLIQLFYSNLFSLRLPLSSANFFIFVSINTCSLPPLARYSYSSSFTKFWPFSPIFISHPSVALGGSCDRGPSFALPFHNNHHTIGCADYTESWTRAHKNITHTCTHMRRQQIHTAAKLRCTKPTRL